MSVCGLRGVGGVPGRVVLALAPPAQQQDVGGCGPPVSGGQGQCPGLAGATVLCSSKVAHGVHLGGLDGDRSCLGLDVAPARPPALRFPLR